MDGSSLSGWTFDAMNVLAWTEEAGCTAWLQFMVQPGGPIFMGTLKTADGGESPAGTSHAHSKEPATRKRLFLAPLCCMRHQQEHRGTLALMPAHRASSKHRLFIYI